MNGDIMLARWVPQDQVPSVDSPGTEEYIQTPIYPSQHS